MTTDNIKLEKNGLIVTIGTSSDEETLIKALKFITYPKTVFDTNPASPDYGPNTTKILDLLMNVEKRITINGYLATGVLSGDSSNSAQDKKDDLKNIFFGGGVVEMTYEGGTFNVGLEKVLIKRILTDGQTPQDGEAEFTVTLTAVRGENMT